MTNQNENLCDLCGLEIKVTGFVLDTQNGEKAFCCEGCHAIYSMLHVNREQPNQDDIELNLPSK